MSQNLEEHSDLSSPTGGQGAVQELLLHIESLIFASDKPLTTIEITELLNSALGFMDDRWEAEQTEAALQGIVEKYDSEFYPFKVAESGGGWQFLTKKAFHKTVAQLNGEKFLKRLSAAALETLAIIAYKQPITKGEIESIRGVSSDYSVQKLLEKELVHITGRNEKLPGHPLVYATSKTFMDYFGINSADDLPKIREVLAEQMVEPTLIEKTDFEETDLVVTGEGELVVQEETGSESAQASDEDSASENNLSDAITNTEFKGTTTAENNLNETETEIVPDGDEAKKEDDETAEQV